MRRKTLNPVWFQADSGTHRKDGSTPKSQSQSQDVSRDCGKPYFWLEGTFSVNPRLRVEVYDWDALGSHDFLGGVELGMDEITDLQRTTVRNAKVSGLVNQQVRYAVWRRAESLQGKVLTRMEWCVYGIREVNMFIPRSDGEGLKVWLYFACQMSLSIGRKEGNRFDVGTACGTDALLLEGGRGSVFPSDRLAPSPALE